MGRMQADEMAAQDVPLDAAIGWHLKYNHYPPHPSFMIPVAIRAIKKANRGEWERGVKLPHGVLYKGSKVAKVKDIVRSLHLDSWVRSDDEEF